MSVCFRLTLAFFIIFAQYFSQDLKQSLLICHAETAENARAQFKQKLYAYHFLNGMYTGREEIMTFDGKRSGKDHIRTDKGKNILYKERFLITGIGNIIDIEEKTILFDGKANLLFIRNDSAIYYTNDAFKGKFYSVFDFKKEQYTEVKNLLFKVRLDKDIEFDKTVKPIKINYYPQGKPKVELLQDAGYGQQKITDNKYIPDPPVYWLDENNFVFAKYNAVGTEIEIQKINLENAKVMSYGKVMIASGNTLAKFELITESTLVLHCGARQIHLNLKNNTISLPELSKPEHGFTYALVDDAKGRSILHSGKEIGKFNFDVNYFAASENIVAAVKVMVVGDEMYQQGLQVWHKTSNTWQKIDSEEVLAIVGWLNK